MAERRQALLIACEEFVDPQYKHLAVPIREARKFAKVLQNPEIGQFSVELLENATRDVITDKLEEFFEKGRPEDVLLLYIAGHGDLDDRRNLYFVAHDTRSKRLRGSGIADQFIHETMVRSLSKKQILILDCCFSGAFSKDWISDWNPRSDASAGIKQKLTGEGRVVLTASDALEYAYERGSAAGEVKSLFSSRLIEGIEGGYADLDGDGLISVDELYRYVEERIRQEDPSQKPQKSGQVYGQLWIGRAVPRPDAIPRNVLDLLNHNYPTVRLAGIDELERLLTVAKDVLYPAASYALTKLLSDGDGTVQRVATSALRRLEAEHRESEEKKRLEAERLEKERLEAEQREMDRVEAKRLEQERLDAEQREKQRPEAEQREKYRIEVEQRERERLDAERQEKKRLEHEARSRPLVKPEAAKPSSETPKEVYPLPSKPTEPGLEKPPRPSKQVIIAVLAVAAVMVIGGLFYLANRPSQSPPPQPAPIAAVTPNPPAIATQTVEGKAPLTPQAAVQPSKMTTQRLSELVQAADAGDNDAMFELGWRYEHGSGGADRDYDKARLWYKKAADAGNVEAWMAKDRVRSAMPEATQPYATPEATQLYVPSKMTTQRLSKLVQAADAGDNDAMFELGWRYEHGSGGADRDYDKARLWYKKAADAGNVEAWMAKDRVRSK
jgi:Caspase domain/Sel1 repeat